MSALNIYKYIYMYIYIICVLNGELSNTPFPSCHSNHLVLTERLSASGSPSRPHSADVFQTSGMSSTDIVENRNILYVFMAN